MTYFVDYDEEEREGRLFGCEFKWGLRKAAAPREWLETYPGSEFSVINRENYLDFVNNS